MMVSRSGYYKWVSRQSKLNRYEAFREWLKGEIIKTSNHRVWGYKHRAQYIRNETGIRFSDQLCHLCCKELGIRSKARTKRNNAGDEHEIYPNILGGFYAQRPFQKVCTDTTILSHKQGNFDWNIYIDLFDHTLVSYDLTKSKKGSDPGNHHRAAKRFIEEKEKRGYKDLETVVHSDQGAIYTSRAFNALFHHTIKRSMSRIATPTDNPIIEALNGWIKDELKYDYHFHSSDDPHQIIKEFVYYFNQKRLAYSLKYKTPNQYRSDLGFT
jgi:transposase InsO family protein